MSQGVVGNCQFWGRGGDGLVLPRMWSPNTLATSEPGVLSPNSVFDVMVGDDAVSLWGWGDGEALVVMFEGDDGVFQQLLPLSGSNMDMFGSFVIFPRCFGLFPGLPANPRTVKPSPTRRLGDAGRRGSLPACMSWMTPGAALFLTPGQDPFGHEECRDSQPDHSDSDLILAWRGRGWVVDVSGAPAMAVSNKH